ncbi:MAG: preprotein translocase subunit SecE [Candidatus Taylorbacteria bacterium]|nr:preprotein translocase subunit SecE [Candidatus Taylorbacteria bacterium]
MDKLISFLKDVKIELSKVSWPTKDQTVQYTLVVLGLSLAIALFLGGIDFVLQLGLNKFVIK